MGKICRVKRKIFLRVRRQLVNNVNTGINSWTLNIESKNDNLNIHDQMSGGIAPATATFAKSNKTFSVSQTPSVSSSKVEDIEEELPKGKKGFLGIVLLTYSYVPL